MAQEVKFRARIRQKRFECLVCFKKFQDGCALRRHNLVHTGEQPYACQLCGRRFARASNLTVHNRVHTGEKPYACQYCPRAFADSSQLKRHVRLHTGEKPYACQHCDKKFSRSGCLVRHNRTHTGEKPYTCEHCSKTFVRVSHLRSHIRVHTGEKPYTCQYCEKAFSYRASLVTHCRIHTGERPYACLLCGKTFPQIAALKYHCMLHAGEQQDFALSDVDEKPFEVTDGKEVVAESDVLVEHIRNYTQRETGHFRSYGSPVINQQTTHNSDRADVKPFDRLLGGQGLAGARVTAADYETDQTGQASNVSLLQSGDARGSISTTFDEAFDLSAFSHAEFINCSTSKELHECIPDEVENGAADESVYDRSGPESVEQSECFRSSVAVDTSSSESDIEYKPDWKLLVQPFVKLFRLTESDLAKKCFQASLEREAHLRTGGSGGGGGLLEANLFSTASQVLVDEKPFYSPLNVEWPTNINVGNADSGARHSSWANNESLSSAPTKRYECLLCFKRFTEAQSLKRHHLLHTGEQPYACQQCGKRFSRSSNLVVHSRVHTGERPYACQVCGRCFADSSRLRRHSQRHTGEKPYACQVCGKRFLQHVSLVEHSRIHTGEKPYVCEHCNRSFARGSHLRRHCRIHTGEKPYSCQLCSKTFADISSHIKHRRVHSGEKPYACEFCGKRFRQDCGLRYHVRTHAKKLMQGGAPSEADANCGLIDTDEVVFGSNGPSRNIVLGERIRKYREQVANHQSASRCAETDQITKQDRTSVDELCDYQQARQQEID